MSTIGYDIILLRWCEIIVCGVKAQELVGMMCVRANCCVTLLSFVENSNMSRSRMFQNKLGCRIIANCS